MNKKNNENKRLDTLDVVKGIAMIMVIIVHSVHKFDVSWFISYPARFGQMGCQIFFVITAFFLCRSYERQKCGRGNMSFIIKKIKAILPGYWIAILLSVALSVFTIVNTGSNQLGTSIEPIHILANVFCLHGLIPVQSINNQVVRGGWYVGTLLLFYIIFPNIYNKFKILQKKGKLKIALCLLLLINFIIMIGLYLFNGSWLCGNNSFFYFSFINQLPCFVLGMYLYNNVNDRLTYNSTTMSLILLSITIVLFYTRYPLFFIFIPFLFGLSVTYFLQSRNLTTCDSKVEKFLAMIGRHSYGIYLIHVFIVYDLAFYIQKTIKINNDILYLIWFPIMMAIVLLIGIYFDKLLKTIHL